MYIEITSLEVETDSEFLLHDLLMDLPGREDR